MSNFFKHFYCRMKYTLVHPNEKFEIIPAVIKNSADKRIKFVTLMLGMIISTVYHVYINRLFDLTYIVTLCTSFAVVFVIMGDEKTINLYLNNWKERYRVPVRYFLMAGIPSPFSAWFYFSLSHYKPLIQSVNAENFIIYIITRTFEMIFLLPFYAIIVYPLTLFVLGTSFWLFNLAIILDKKTFE